MIESPNIAEKEKETKSRIARSLRPHSPIINFAYDAFTSMRKKGYPLESCFRIAVLKTVRGAIINS
jgi:hypothetical protein